MRHRIEEALPLDVVIDADAREMPLGILELVRREILHDGALDRLEQLASAHAEAAHIAAVQPLPRSAGGGVAPSQGEKRDVARRSQDLGLCEPRPRLHGRLVARAPRAGW